MREQTPTTEPKKFYRVNHETSEQGLWYDFKGQFTGLIHNALAFCKNSALRMEFDPEIVGFLSAADTLDNLFVWFTREDIIELQKRGFYIYEYVTADYKWYDRFSHWIINQNNSTQGQKIVLESA